MKRTPYLLAVALVATLVVLTALACGGSAAVTSSPTQSLRASSVPHDTSSPAKALIGHWKDANAMNQYFDASVWSTVTSGNEKWKYGYTVQSESVDRREVVLRTFAIQTDGSTDTDVEVITFHFLNGRMPRSSGASPA